jgi:putative ABC transport system permease protein
MLKNYFLVAWRSLVKHRALSLINVCGLAISVALVLQLFLYIRREQSYDGFHANGHRLFQLEMTSMFHYNVTGKVKKASWFSSLAKGDEGDYSTAFPVVVGPDLERTFPEIKHATRMSGGPYYTVRVGNRIFSKVNVLHADDHFFSTFSFPLKVGNPGSALSSRDGMVLSASTAARFFGAGDPIGKTFSFTDDSSHIYTVAAVAADAPGNSSIQFEIVAPIKAYPDYEERMKSGFNNANHRIVVELAPGVNAAGFEQKLDRWAQGYWGQEAKSWGDSTGFHWYLRPLADAHYNASTSMGHYTDTKNLYELGCLVLIVLGIASLNYILLAVSGAAARSQEVGVRKAMGAKRKLVVLQFWVEAQVVVCISVLVGLGLSMALLPAFNRIMDTTVSFRDCPFYEIVLAVVALCGILGLLAGFYPAWLLSRVRTVSVMQSSRTFKVNPRFSRVVVVVQYTACIALMMAAFVIARQMHYINDKDLGFDKDQVLLVDNDAEGIDAPTLHQRLAAFAAKEPSILQFSAMNGGLNGSGDNNGFKLHGEQKWLRSLSVDYGYFNLMGVPLVRGRLFSPSFATDTILTPRRVVVNETLFKLLGDSAQIGQYNEQIHEVIIGVVRDYNTSDLTIKLQPEEHRLIGKYERTFLFKLRAGQTREALERIGSEWKALSNGYPFSYTFLDESLQKMYVAQEQWEHIILVSCFFAVFIACMGLFGLSAINAANRTKEVGIRKVLGASVRDVVLLLCSHFLGLVAIALVIALPLAWWMMSGYLDDFAYRIDMTWWMGALVGLAAISIALFTVSFQSYRAATANPVDSLRAD